MRDCVREEETRVARVGGGQTAVTYRVKLVLQMWRPTGATSPHTRGER